MPDVAKQLMRVCFESNTCQPVLLGQLDELLDMKAAGQAVVDREAKVSTAAVGNVCATASKIIRLRILADRLKCPYTPTQQDDCADHQCTYACRCL